MDSGLDEFVRCLFQRVDARLTGNFCADRDFVELGCGAVSADFAGVVGVVVETSRREQTVFVTDEAVAGDGREIALDLSSYFADSLSLRPASYLRQTSLRCVSGNQLMSARKWVISSALRDCSAGEGPASGVSSSTASAENRTMRRFLVDRAISGDAGKPRGEA